LWALGAKTGRMVGDKSMHTPFSVGSRIADGETLIGSDSGSVIAVPLAAIRSSHDS